MLFFEFANPCENLPQANLIDVPHRTTSISSNRMTGAGLNQSWPTPPPAGWWPMRSGLTVDADPRHALFARTYTPRTLECQHRLQTPGPREELQRHPPPDPHCPAPAPPGVDQPPRNSAR
ncbi:MAG: hypothetical protein CMJ70_14410 [Planctomycetaceae bacterium]|nr:hypothetical protein [Planctomycetaceae bacterium]